MQMGYDFDQTWPEADVAAIRARIAGVPGEPAIADSAAGRAALADAAAVPAGPAQDLPPRHPDWAALRARFAAIHALRRALRDEMPAPLATGSFAAASDPVLASCRTGSAVNPVYWANIKAPCAMTGPVAVPPHAATEE